MTEQYHPMGDGPAASDAEPCAPMAKLKQMRDRLHRLYVQRFGDTFSEKWLDEPECLVLIIWALERHSPITELGMQAYLRAINALRLPPAA
jgi:hypothetical protein